MITDIPSKDEFFERADSLIQLAFTIVSNLYEAQTSDWAEEAGQDLIDTYWEKCKIPLANSLSLIQQAHELYLKGKIAEISPFLLIARDPASWPSNARTTDISFSQFLTVGASELPKLYDMVCSPRLDDAIKLLLTDIREKRNGFVHQGNSPSSTVEELFEAILQTHLWIHRDEPWFAARAHHLENDHISSLYSSDHVLAGLHKEFAALLKIFSPAKFRNFFNFKKKDRWCYCPECRRGTSDYGDPEKTAQVVALDVSSKVLSCLVCGAETELVVQPCNDPSCTCDLMTTATVSWDSVCIKCDEYGDKLLYDAEKAKEAERPTGLLSSLFVSRNNPF